MDKRAPTWVAPTLTAVGLLFAVGGSYVVQQVQNEARNGAQDALILVLQADVENLKSVVDRRLQGIEKDIDAIGAKLDRLLEARR